MPTKKTTTGRFWHELSWLAFNATIILISFRLRFLLLSRPVPPVWRDYTDFLVFASDIALLLCVFAWLAWVRSTGRKLSWAPRLITLPVLGLTALGGLSVFASVDPGLSLYHFVRLVALFGFLLFVIDQVKSLDQIALPLVVQIALQSVVAIGQAFTQRSLGLPRLGEYELDPAWSGVSIVLTQSSRFLRAYGLSDHPNILGGCLAFALVLLFVYIATQKQVGSSYWVVFAVGSLALFYTFSRSAWLALGLGLGLCLLLIRRSSKPLAWQRAWVLLAVTAILMAPWVWRQRDLLGIRLGGAFQANPAEVKSLGERAYLLDAGSQLFERHPITGVGLGAAPVALAREFPNFPVSYQPPHFVILESAVETGLVGATFFLALLAIPWLVLWRKRSMPFTPGLIAAFGLLLSISVVGFFDYYPWLLAPGRLWLWLGWGLWGAFYLADPKKA
jgi:hypothetical protein